MTECRASKKPKRTYLTSGLYTLGRSLRGIDMGKLDRRPVEIATAIRERRYRSNCATPCGGEPFLRASGDKAGRI